MRKLEKAGSFGHELLAERYGLNSVSISSAEESPEDAGGIGS